MHSICSALVICFLFHAVSCGTYNTQTVSFPSSSVASGFLNLTGTIYLPIGLGGLRPAAVLLPDDGAIDRDGTTNLTLWKFDLSATTPDAIRAPLCISQSASVATLSLLAETLSNNGWIVLRFDRRDCWRSTGSYCRYTLCSVPSQPDCVTQTAIRYTDLVADALAAHAYLRTVSAVDNTRMSMIGIGDGGKLALLAANSTSTISRVAMLMTSGLAYDADVTASLSTAVNALTLGEPICLSEGRPSSAQLLQNMTVSTSASLAATGAYFAAVRAGTTSALFQNKSAEYWSEYLAYTDIRFMSTLLSQYRGQVFALFSSDDQVVGPSQYAPLQYAVSAASGRVITMTGVLHELIPSDLSSGSIPAGLSGPLLRFLNGVMEPEPSPWYATLILVSLYAVSGVMVAALLIAELARTMSRLRNRSG